MPTVNESMARRVRRLDPRNRRLQVARVRFSGLIYFLAQRGPKGLRRAMEMLPPLSKGNSVWRAIRNGLAGKLINVHSSFSFDRDSTTTRRRNRHGWQAIRPGRVADFAWTHGGRFDVTQYKAVM